MVWQAGAETADVARAFQSDHQVHRDVLAEQIRSRGRIPVQPLDPEQYADSYPPMLTAAQIVAYAVKLEAAAARAGIDSVAEYEDRHLALVGLIRRSTRRKERRRDAASVQESVC